MERNLTALYCPGCEALLGVCFTFNPDMPNSPWYCGDCAISIGRMADTIAIVILNEAALGLKNVPSKQDIEALFNSDGIMNRSRYANNVKDWCDEQRKKSTQEKVDYLSQRSRDE